jgi:hypothetical protein
VLRLIPRRAGHSRAPFPPRRPKAPELTGHAGNAELPPETRITHGSILGSFPRGDWLDLCSNWVLNSYVQQKQVMGGWCPGDNGLVVKIQMLKIQVL